MRRLFGRVEKKEGKPPPLHPRERTKTSLGFSLGLNAYDAAVACATLEDNSAVCERVEGVIGTHTHVLAGVVSGAALANDDVTGYASLSAPDLNTQTL